MGAFKTLNIFKKLTDNADEMGKAMKAVTKSLHDLHPKTKGLYQKGAGEKVWSLQKEYKGLEGLTTKEAFQTKKGSQFGSEKELAKQVPGGVKAFGEVSNRIIPGTTKHPENIKEKGNLSFTEKFKNFGDKMGTNLTKALFAPLWLPAKTAGKIISGTMNHFKKNGDAMNQFNSGIGNIVAMGVQGAAIGILIKVLTVALGPLIEVFNLIMEVFGTKLSESFLPLMQTLMDVFLSDEMMSSLTLLTGALMQVVIAILPLVGLFASLVPLLIGVAIPLLNVITVIINGLMVPIMAIGVVFTAIVKGITAGLTWLGNLTSGLSEGWKALMTKVTEGFLGVINWVITGINNLFNLTGGKYEIKTLSMPAYANGGWAYTPQVAKLAEKEPELVIPQSKMDKLSNSGITININGNITQDVLIEMQKEVWFQKHWGR